MKHMNKKAFGFIGIVIAIAVLALVGTGVWYYKSAKSPQAQTQPRQSGKSVLIIESPANGAVYHVGDVVHFKVSPIYGYSFEEVDVLRKGTPIHKSTTVGPPFEVDVPLSDVEIGPVEFIVTGFTDRQRGLSGVARIVIDVQPAGSTSVLAVVVSGRLQRMYPNDEVQVTADAKESDGSVVNIDRASDAVWSVRDENVAEVVVGRDGERLVHTLDYGATEVRVAYRGAIGAVRVEVGVGGRRGDVNLDEQIDGSDEAIIQGALGKKANPEDPRDLNGDGVIDKFDLEIFKQNLLN
jgi:hypothetical protein